MTRRARPLLRDRHRLDIHKLADPFRAELAAKSGAFAPPNGNRGSDATMLLMKTIPASNSEAKSRCSAGSFVQALAPSRTNCHSQS